MATFRRDIDSKGLQGRFPEILGLEMVLAKSGKECYKVTAVLPVS